MRVDYPSRRVNVLGCIPLFVDNPRFMLTSFNVNPNVFVEFLHLVRARNSGIIVLDNVRFHKTAYVFPLLLN